MQYSLVDVCYIKQKNRRQRGRMAMKLPLFIYGTLRHAAVRDAVFERQTALDDFVFQPAYLPCHAVYHVDGTAYPMIIAEQETAAIGLCWHGLTDDDLAVLDRFEGENYQRVPIDIVLSEINQRVRAEIYQPRTRLKQGKIWDFDEWSKTGLDRFLTHDFNLAGVRAPA